MSTLPAHGIQLVLNSVGNMGMGIDMQQDDVIDEFTSTFFLDLGGATVEAHDSNSWHLMCRCVILSQEAGVP